MVLSKQSTKTSHASDLVLNPYFSSTSRFKLFQVFKFFHQFLFSFSSCLILFCYINSLLPFPGKTRSPYFLPHVSNEPMNWYELHISLRWLILFKYLSRFIIMICFLFLRIYALSCSKLI